MLIINQAPPPYWLAYIISGFPPHPSFLVRGSVAPGGSFSVPFIGTANLGLYWVASDEGPPASGPDGERWNIPPYQQVNVSNPNAAFIGSIKILPTGVSAASPLPDERTEDPK